MSCLKRQAQAIHLAESLECQAPKAEIFPISNKEPPMILKQEVEMETLKY